MLVLGFFVALLCLNNDTINVNALISPSSSENSISDSSSIQNHHPTLSANGEHSQECDECDECKRRCKKCGRYTDASSQSTTSNTNNHNNQNNNHQSQPPQPDPDHKSKTFVTFAVVISVIIVTLLLILVLSRVYFLYVETQNRQRYHRKNNRRRRSSSSSSATSSYSSSNDSYMIRSVMVNVGDVGNTSANGPRSPTPLPPQQSGKQHILETVWEMPDESSVSDSTQCFSQPLS